MTVRYKIKKQVIRPLANTATQTAQTALLNTYSALGQTGNTPTPVLEGDLNNFNHDYGEDSVRTYWYHPDHLGSSSYITNLEGIVTQHLEYMPYGEPSPASSPTPKKSIKIGGQSLVEEHQNSINTPYKFNGKEQDDETGNYYYGARYYNPKFSFWLSVDPLAEKGPQYSPYNYCFNNPINLTDPDGRWPDPPFGYRLSASFSFGSGGLGFNLTGSIGYQNNIYNLDRQIFLSGSVYAGGNQLGRSTMDNKIRWDVTLTVIATLGGSEGQAHNMYSIN